MVKVDFTSYTSLSTCPKWWINFIQYTTDGITGISSSEKSDLVDRALLEHGCLAIDNPNNIGDLICLVFESQEACDAFRTYWALKG